MKRDNQNIGTLSMQTVMFMTNYGITDKLNMMATMPYVKNVASAGTLHQMDGLQDANIYLKWKPLSVK